MQLFNYLKILFSAKYTFALSLSALVFLSFTADSFAAAGNLDRTFGEGGKAISYVNGTEKAHDVIVQPNGKIIVVGGVSPTNTNFDFLIQRYNTDGTLDADFGSGGSVIVPVGASNDVAYGAAIQSDGKIVVVGYAQQPTNYADFGIIRLLPDGQIDQSFGNGGKLMLAPTISSDIAYAVKMQTVNSVEKIIVGGAAGTADVKFCLARLDLNGQLDAGFGDNGLKSVPVGGVTDSLQDLTIDGEGRIVAAGYSRFNLSSGFRDDFAVVRFLPDGSLDTGFSNDGKVITQMAGHSQPRAVVIEKGIDTEKIVVGGFSRNGNTNDFALVRYNFDGTVDTTFGINGKLYTDFTGSDDQIHELLAQPDGKIVGVGFTSYASNQNFALTRYNVNGTLDKTFGSCGRIITDLRTNTDISYGAALQADGKIVAVGESTNGSTGADFTAVRYTTGGQAIAAGDADFDGDGKADVSVFRPSNGTWYMNCSCQSFRTVKFGQSGDIPQAADFDGDGRTDQAVYRRGTWYISSGHHGEMKTVQFGLEGDIPTVGDYDGDEKADVSVWRPSTGVWYVLKSSDGQNTSTLFGLEGDKPVPADYDMDGKTDLAIYRGGAWWIKQSSDVSGNLTFHQFGLQTDIPLKGDFDGDGRADLNVYRSFEGNWYQQSTTAIKITHFGIATDKPVQADYDGDGKSDIAVYRDGVWYVLFSSNNSYHIIHFGLNSDLPALVR